MYVRTFPSERLAAYPPEVFEERLKLDYENVQKVLGVYCLAEEFKPSDFKGADLTLVFEPFKETLLDQVLARKEQCQPFRESQL